MHVKKPAQPIISTWLSLQGYKEYKDLNSYMTPLNVYVFGPNLLQDLQLQILFQSESKWKQLRLFVMSISKVDCEPLNLYLL